MTKPLTAMLRLRAVFAVVVVAAVTVILNMGMTGCSLVNRSEFSPSECPALPSDQHGSFMAPLDSQPARVQIDATFTSEQQDAIVRAVSRWNSFSQNSIHRDFFAPQVTTGISLAPSDTTTTDDDPKIDDGATNDACEFITEDADSFRISKETSQTHWKALGLKENNPGVTLRCYIGSSLVKQIVLLNPKYAVPEQFMSIVLHELGHSIGLNHSCTNDQNISNFASCASIQKNTEHPYHLAIMFPVLGTQVLKENLRSNDKERASCLYSGR